MGVSIYLYNNDCISMMQGMRKDSISLILTDPPYNLGIFTKKRKSNVKSMRSNFFNDAGWDNHTKIEWSSLMDSFFSESVRILKKGGCIIQFAPTIRVSTVFLTSS